MFVPCRSLYSLLCAVALLMFGIGSTMAQPYPNKPIKFVARFVAGSSSDIAARTVAAHMANKLGQSSVPTILGAL